MGHTISSSRHAAQLRTLRLPELYEAERAFVHLYGDRDWAFWLDTAVPGRDGRFSFIGDAGGPHGSAVSYDVGERCVRVERGEEVETFDESIFGYLSRQLKLHAQAGHDLPFDFGCGFVGYLGYELKAELDGAAAHESPLPDAAFVFADRVIAFDHAEGCTWLVCLAGDDDPAGHWLEEAAESLRSLPPLDDRPARQIATRPAGDAESDLEVSTDLHLRRSSGRYLEDIEACRDRLIAGESYEVCLTNKAVAAAPPDPLALYRELRRLNPAPYGAFLRLGEATVLSSSPERFLRVAPDRWVEARPIKGTSRRGSTTAADAQLAANLASDEKTRAENVTIVDLLRNDLGIVCEPGTVHVADLMRVETYETVHQLVSTVRGRLRANTDVVDCVRACFPPGSMTGAPKRRTMEILDELEGEARGVYSGAIGYLGLGGGCDLSVAIRTIVIDGDEATVGCGGAVVLDSDPEQELEEMLLKGEAAMRAIDAVGRASPA